MLPSEVLRRASRYLDRRGVQSPRATAEVLLMHVLGTDRAGLYARGESLDPGEARMFGLAICQRGSGVPLQHLTGEQAFRRLVLEVRPGVFVPRPETEVLVESALGVLGGLDAPVVADVGTGTGAIALAIKHEWPRARVFATDRSPEATELARANAERLDLDVTVLEGDLLSPLPPGLLGRLDLVVSNPPYVPPSDLQDLPPEVRADPPLALFGEIGVYARLADQARRWLRRGGVLAVEIDARRGPEVVSLLERGLVEVRVERDMTGRDRAVIAHRP